LSSTLVLLQGKGLSNLNRH